MAGSPASAAGWGPPPARRAREALDDHATVNALLAGHRQAVRCFEQVRPLLPETLAALVRPGPIDAGTWTLFVEHASAAAKLRQLLPALQVAASAVDASIAQVRLKVVSGRP